MESSDSVSLLKEADDSIWRRYGVYWIGLFIVYAGITWSFAVGYSSNPKTQLVVGVIMGPLIATLPAGIHLIFQWVARKITRKLFKWGARKEVVVLNLPALVLMAMAVGPSYYFTSARPIFEQYVTKPIPSSVRIVEYGGGQINISEGASVGIHFQIEPEELQKLLLTGGFMMVDDDSGLNRWKYCFSHYAQIDMAFTTPYVVYYRNAPWRANTPSLNPDEEKTYASPKVSELTYEKADFLFCPTNSREVYYLRLAH